MKKLFVFLLLLGFASMLFGETQIQLGVFGNIKNLRSNITKIKPSTLRKHIVLNKHNKLYDVHAVIEGNEKEIQNALKAYQVIFRDAYIVGKVKKINQFLKEKETASKNTNVDTTNTLFRASKAYKRGDYAQVKNILKKAGHKGELNAQLELAVLYENGDGLPQSYQNAFFWYEKAASKSPYAMYKVGRFHEEGKGVEKNATRSMEYYHKSAELNNLHAQYRLGEIYYEGIGVKQEVSQAFIYYQKAAQNNHLLAQYTVGVMYENAIGIKTDYAKSLYWYEEAAKKGHLNAQYNAASFYYEGKGVPSDQEKAAYWFEKAASQGDAQANYNLGLMYFNGKSISKNKILAFEYWMEAAKKSHIDSQKALDLLCKESPWACK